MTRRYHEEQERQPREQQPDRELRRRRWLETPELDPQPRERGRQHDHEQRLHRHEPARWKREAQYRRVAVAVAEKIQRRPGLFIRAPEHGSEYEEHAHRGEPLPFHFRESPERRLRWACA